jgi:hypothetical protein
MNDLMDGWMNMNDWSDWWVNGWTNGYERMLGGFMNE